MGDIGRSPRMQYHASSLAAEEFYVDIVGFSGSELISDLQDNSHVNICHVSKPISRSGILPGILHYILKSAFQTVQLGWVLFAKMKTPSHILLQNPPCIPALLVCWLLSCVKGSTLIIDWHNYAYTILKMNAKSDLLVRIATYYERILGRCATHNLCVTSAMKRDLHENWSINAHVLYDRPPNRFRESTVWEKHELFMKLKQQYAEFSAKDDQTEATAFTSILDSSSNDKCGPREATLRSNRPVLLVSSTSWTEDEDFSILLNAMELFDQAAKETPSAYPTIICCITGKGPLKEYYRREIDKRELSHVLFVMPWLTAQDYPLLISAADVGVCLHTSSSGLDLPMKVVDMHGCCVPALAVGFPALPELVRHGENGLIFESAQQLTDQLLDLLCDFPECLKQGKLSHFREQLRVEKKTRGDWHANWTRVVLPLFQ